MKDNTNMNIEQAKQKALDYLNRFKNVSHGKIICCRL